MNPTQSDVHVNVPLGNVSVGWQQDQTKFIAGQIFPTVKSPTKSNRYFKYSRADFFRSVAGVRAPSTEAPGGGYRVDSTPNFNCEVVSVRKDIDDGVRANSDQPLDSDRDATIWVTQQLLLKRDLDWVSKYFKSGVWGVDADVTNASYGNGRWSAAGSTPIKDLRAQIVAMMRNTSMKPNCLTLGTEVWQVLQDHPDFLDRIAFGQVGNASIVTPNLLAQILGIEKVVIAEAIYSTANEGATDAYSFILGKHALLTYGAKEASVWQPSAGYTFVWTGYFGASAEGSRILKMRDDPKHTDIIEGEMGYDINVVCSELGCFFPSVVS